MLESQRGEKCDMLVLHKFAIFVVSLLLVYEYYNSSQPLEIRINDPKFALLGPYNATEPTQVDDVYDQLMDLKNFSFTVNPQPCQNYTAGLFLVVIISSKPTNYKNRMIIRSTWGRSLDSTKVVFLIGESKNATISHNIQNESLTFGDIVQGNFTDAYRNMTYKHVMGLKWVTHHCPMAKYIMKTDDDVVVNSHALRQFLTRELSPWGAKGLIMCPVLYRAAVQRSHRSKWRVSPAEYSSHYYPTYCAGYAIIYSQDVVPRLLRAAQMARYFWIDDVLITGMLAEQIGVARTPLHSLVLSKSRAKKLTSLGIDYTGQFLFGPPDISAFVVSGAALNIAGHGCAHGYPAVLFQQLRDETAPLHLTAHDMSWIASVVGAMGLVGNFISPVLMSRFGRQKANLISILPALLGWIVFVLANSVPMFLVARLLHGLALGLRTPLAAILVAEYTEPKYRGAFLGTFAISLGLGIFLSHIWGAHLTWKVTAMVCAMFPVVAMGIISLSPESPSWLVSKGKYDEAKKAFRWLRGDGPEQRAELEAMIEAQKKERITSAKESKQEKRNLKKFVDTIKEVMKIFRKKEFYKPSIIAISMLIVFEFGGAHMVPAYGNDILKAVLNKSDASEVVWQFTVIDLLRSVCAFIAIFLLKFFKRRTILFTSGIMTVLSLSLISVFVYLRQFSILTNGWLLDVVPMALMVLYTVSFCLGLVPLTWVICGEIFPLAYRSLGSTLSTSFLTPAFVVSMKTAPHLYVSIGVEGAFLVYSALLSVCLLIIYALLPETKDRTLQDIEDSFKGKNSSDIESEMSLMDNKDVGNVK